jgi:hypothetical protein
MKERARRLLICRPLLAAAIGEVRGRTIFQTKW